MKAVVFAYHNIGCEGINALIENGFEIQCIFTHTDNPSENTWFRSVAELASAKGIELCGNKYNLPITDEYADKLLRLPCYYELTMEEIKYIVAKIYEFYNGE